MRMNHIQYVHMLMDNRIGPGDSVCDLTLGNGHDMRKLLERVGPTGFLLGFDIAESAVRKCRQIVEDHFSSHHAELIRGSHAKIPIDRGPFQFAVFNFGYLPGSEKIVTTHPLSSIQCIQGMLPLLSADGMLCLTCYRKHDLSTEYAAITAYLSTLNDVTITMMGSFPTNQDAPVVFTIEKRKGQ